LTLFLSLPIKAVAVVPYLPAGAHVVFHGVVFSDPSKLKKEGDIFVDDEHVNTRGPRNGGRGGGGTRGRGRGRTRGRGRGRGGRGGGAAATNEDANATESNNPAPTPAPENTAASPDTTPAAPSGGGDDA